MRSAWIPFQYNGCGRTPFRHIRCAASRVVSSFRGQGMIRDGLVRGSMFDLDAAIPALAERLGRDDPETLKLTGIYHNPIRYWAEV